MRRPPLPLLALCYSLILTACHGSPTGSGGAGITWEPGTGDGAGIAAAPLAGMPALLDPHDVYAADRPGALSPVVKGFPSRIYVPNSDSDTVDVIDPATMTIVDHFGVGHQPQHVVPSYDLKMLYATNDLSNTLTPIDPATGKPGEAISVADPYNMYFTPDGKAAIVVAERLERLDFRDPHTFAMQDSLPVPCAGVDHMDFSADGTYLVASCEFAGSLIKVDVAQRKVVGMLGLPKHGKTLGKPQDVKLSPDGR
ncbi:MAG TPA: hypothetical protein VF972_00255, partial [Actinomycetota bacterium]